MAPGRISICHATGAGTFVQITVDRSGLNGHGDHLDDIIPAPADGCPYSIRQLALNAITTTTAPTTGSTSSTSTTVERGKITICHATSAGFHVEITVDRNGLNGHGDHEGDLIPAPDGGCPSRVDRQSEPSTTTTLPRGKVAICHALGGGKYSRLMINRSDLGDH
ncbi:MAG: hypothetical protein EBU84_10990, partial [Actinobacteria bacterium]|nr:hypothetical protein [Actinomycetota bacterium]